MCHASGELDRVRNPKIRRHAVDELAARAELREVGPVRIVLGQKGAQLQRASRRIGRIEERVRRRVVRIERVAPDREERLVDIDVVVVEVG